MSYRHDPDAPIAESVKQFITNSLDPSPSVFVASSGGIRPDDTPFMAQIHSAVRRTVAMVAVITHASKDRNWVIFEAGAAWGRKIPYQALLFETKPDDLPDVLRIYQLTSAKDVDAVGSFIRVLAEKCESRLRQNWKRHFETFRKSIALTGHQNSSEEEVAPSDCFGIANHATLLWLTDKRQESEQAFNRALSMAGDQEERALVHVLRAVYTTETFADARDRLERVDSAFKTTGIYLYYDAWLEADSRPHVARRKYAALLQGSPPSWMRRQATVQLAELEVVGGNLSAGLSILMAALRSDDASMRQAAAFAWIDATKGHPANELAKLLVLLRARSSRERDLLRRLSDLSIEQGWRSLAIYFSSKYEGLDDTGAGANQVGRASAIAELPSMAYDAYQRAIDKGVTVALPNQASLIQRGGVASAGLRLLREHSKGFDAASPGFPYEIRSELEEFVHKEQASSAEHMKLGERLASVLAELVDLAMEEVSAVPPAAGAAYASGSIGAILAPRDGNGFTLTLHPSTGGKAAHTLLPLQEIPGLWFLTSPQDLVCGLYRFESDGSLSGASFGGLTDTSIVKRERYVPGSTPIAESPTALVPLSASSMSRPLLD